MRWCDHYYQFISSVLTSLLEPSIFSILATSFVNWTNNNTDTDTLITPHQHLDTQGRKMVFKKKHYKFPPPAKKIIINKAYEMKSFFLYLFIYKNFLLYFWWSWVRYWMNYHILISSISTINFSSVYYCHHALCREHVYSFC